MRSRWRSLRSLKSFTGYTCWKNAITRLPIRRARRSLCVDRSIQRPRTLGNRASDDVQSEIDGRGSDRAGVSERVECYEYAWRNDNGTARAAGSQAQDASFQIGRQSSNQKA